MIVDWFSWPPLSVTQQMSGYLVYFIGSMGILRQKKSIFYISLICQEQSYLVVFDKFFIFCQSGTKLVHAC